MLNKKQAFELALQKIMALPKGISSPELVIIEEKTIEEDFGWVFFYQSKLFVETGNIMHALGGGGPIFIDKETEQVIQVGSRLPSSDYIKLYKKYRDDLPLFSKICGSYIHGDPI